MNRVGQIGLIPASVLLSVVLWGCGDGSPMGPVEEIPGLPRALSMSEEFLIEAGNDFAFRLLDQAYGEAPDSNLFLAPLSASMALGMTMNGAAGDTFEEMRATLGFGSLALDQINEGYRDLIELLLSLDHSVEVGIGNSIWYRQGYPVRPDFVAGTQDYFGAEVSALNFADPGAANIINSWVRGQTMGKIEEIVEHPIDPYTVMFLINAIYFKGSWTHRFEKGKTTQATFTGESGATGHVPLMELNDTLLYAENQTYEVVDLPYGGRAFSMTVILPRLGTSVGEIVESLTPSAWDQIIGSLEPKEGTVYLPRFRLEWEKVLNETLQSMGMNLPFIPGMADFTGISDMAQQIGLYISKVKQKTYVDVNEEGTEAAGVTSVEIKEVSIPDRFFFRADRPFLFLIRERFSETILFAGVLVEPPEA